MATEPSTRIPDGRLVLLTCVWLALAGGAGELAVLWVRKSQRPMLLLSQDYSWSVPLALLVTALAASLPFLLAGRWRPREAFSAALFVTAAVVSFDLLLLVPRLAPYAALLLAAGVAAQVGRFLMRDAARTRRFVRRSLPVTSAIVVLMSVGIWMSTDSASQPQPATRSSGPNVLFITLDTVRADSLSLYGAQRETTPHLVRYGARGVVFEQAFATAPWTLPSHASLFTGRWPHELSTGYHTPLDSRHETLAENFAARGYATAGFVANLGYCSRTTGLGRGFGHYEDFPRTPGQIVSNSTLLRSIADNFSVRRMIGNDEHLNRVTGSDLNARLLSWLAGRSSPGDAPFFAFLNYFDAHDPYLPPPPFDRAFGSGRRNGRHSPLHHAQWNPSAPSRELLPDDLQEEIDAYDSALAYLDAQIGALLDALDASGVLSRTLVVITADHGEEFAEHRVLEHGYSLYRPALQVPLLLILPNRVPAGQRVQTPVSLRDVAATVLELTGAAAHSFPGQSLSPLWESRPTIDRPVFSELSKPPGDQPEWYPIRKGDMQSLVYGGFRYIRNGDGTEELYAVGADPWERRNLAAGAEHASLLLEARTRVDAIISRGR